MKFRTRIFSMSIITVSAVLAVVITLSWSRIMKVELERLDARLCMEAKGMMHKPFNIPRVPNGVSDPLSHKELLIPNTGRSGVNLINDLVSKLRTNSASQLMVFLETNEDGLLAKSENVDIEKIMGSLKWVNATNLQSTDKSRSNTRCQLASFEHQQSQWRASFFNSSQRKSFIAVDISAPTSELQDTLQSAFIVVIPFSLLLSIFGAWFIASNTIRPINRLHKSMDMVTQKDLSHRLPQHKEDKEFKVLIDAYNTMLNRLEISFQQATRFTADAAHELKTPLTVLRGKLELAVSSENTSKLDINGVLDEVGHLSAMTRKLLLLSQADSCSMALHLEPIHMSDFLDELTSDMELMSENLVLNCSIDPNLHLKGDIVLIRQLFNNLLVNVIRYSIHEQGVNIEAKQNESSIEVLIRNFCLPISDDVRDQLFDRFYRGEPKQMQGISGSGLGLSLAREIARAHGGDLTIEPSVKNAFSMKLVLPIVK